jgi:hypothetical protein
VNKAQRAVLQCYYRLHHPTARTCLLLDLLLHLLVLLKLLLMCGHMLFQLRLIRVAHGCELGVGVLLQRLCVGAL